MHACMRTHRSLALFHLAAHQTRYLVGHYLALPRAHRSARGRQVSGEPVARHCHEQAFTTTACIALCLPSTRRRHRSCSPTSYSAAVVNVDTTAWV